MKVQLKQDANSVVFGDLLSGDTFRLSPESRVVLLKLQTEAGQKDTCAALEDGSRTIVGNDREVFPCNGKFIES